MARNTKPRYPQDTLRPQGGYRGSAERRAKGRFSYPGRGAVKTNYTDSYQQRTNKPQNSPMKATTPINSRFPQT